ncbi:QRFP-like peptide receptor [Montipora foliosa]|uniref:QRFP-like peptide receptor n=1 Tax=Montipora foliosa TaxID=591990 RepID=UPI0035F1B4C2
MPVNMTTTINGSANCYFEWYPTVTASKIGATLAYCLILVVSLLGNSCIGIIVYKTKTLRKPINILIVNMAMSDLFVPLIFIPMEITELYGYSWFVSGVLGNGLCKLIPFLFDVSYTVSVQSLILIAVGRFGAVVCPLRSPLITSKQCPFFIIASWIVAMVVQMPLLLGYNLQENGGEEFCVLKWEKAFGQSASSADIFLVYQSVFLFTPFIFLILIYSIILIKLKSQMLPGDQSTDAKIKRRQQNKNVLKLAIAIVLGLFFCKLPFAIIALMYLYGTFPCGFSPYLFSSWMVLISYCGVNPCICFAFCRNYREGLKRLLKCSSDAS